MATAFVFNQMGSAGIEIRLTRECYLACSRRGQCDGDVEAWANILRKRMARISSDCIRRILKGYGAWDESELTDDEANLHRILWIAAGNCREDGSCWTFLDA